MRNLPRIFGFVPALIFGALLLAACSGGDEEPTATPPAPEDLTATAVPGEPVATEFFDPFPTIPPRPTLMPSPVIDETPYLVSTLELPVIPVGTLVLIQTAAPMPDMSGGFDSVILVRTGGPVDDQGNTFDETIIIERGGAITRNGASGRASAEGLQDIYGQLQAANVFMMQANFISGAPPDNLTYHYQLFVKQGSLERLIMAQDGMMPIELSSIITAILTEGFKIPRP